MKKKRNLERFDLKLPVTVEVLGGAEAKTLELETSNISADGAYFATRRPLDRGEKVKMRMVLPAVRRKNRKSGRQAQVEVKGVVCRSESQGMAISFEGFRMMRQQP
jgi:hypothetical protein